MSQPATHTGKPSARRRIDKLLGAALILLSLAMALPAVASASGSSTGATSASAPKPVRTTSLGARGRVIVKYRLSESAAAARSAAAATDAQVVGRVRTFGLKTTGRCFVVSSDTLGTAALMKQYGADPAVEYVEPDYVVHADVAVTPNDPSFGSLWGMAKISAPLAWGISTGQPSVVVADIDTGVDYTHPDLVANMWHNPGEIADNGIDDDANGYIDDVYGIDTAYKTSDPSDPHGHGTHTSGTMAAAGNNAVGVTGVCWSAQIMALEFMDASGAGYTSDAITCINYMTYEKVHYGVNVVAANNSWSGGAYSQLLHDAIATAGNAGIVFVCAAGNGGSDGIGDNNDSMPVYPASYDCSNMITVAATDGDDALASFSNWGATSVDMAAPGVGILSTYPGGGYVSWNGTSMATPHVTGAIALMAAAYPAETMATRISIIESTVDPVAGLAGMVVTGGRLDLARALYRLTLTGFSPVSGPVGTGVTLTGTGFTGTTTVAFNGAPASYSVGSDAQITAIVPPGAASGAITVTTPYGTVTSTTIFTVTKPAKPAIAKLRPAKARRGATVTITGSGFGTQRGTVRFGTKKCTKYISWSDTRIKCKVPARAKIGKIKITVVTTAGASKAKPFKVKR